MIREMFSAEKYTTEELNARLKFFIGVILGLTLFGIVFVVLYSLIFVVQPMNGMSPVDNKFFELIIPIATFLTGTLSGIMLAGDDKDMRKAAMDAANKPPTTPAPTSPVTPKLPTPGVGSSAFSASMNVPLSTASPSLSVKASVPTMTSTEKEEVDEPPMFAKIDMEIPKVEMPKINVNK